MSKILMGAVVKKNDVQATYRVTVLGETQVKTKAKDWSEALLAKVAEFVKAADALTPELDDIIGVQVYTEITDPIGGGLLIDLIFVDGNQHRVNNPPANLATLRDEVKAALGAEL